MHTSSPVDGFRLAYERDGAGPPVVLLHGWPGDRTDYREVVAAAARARRRDRPDLRGFGASDKHPADPAAAYSAAAQARSVIGLVEELGLERPVVGRLRHRQPGRAGDRAGRARPRARAGRLPAAAGGRRSGARRRGAARVLVPGVPPARARRGADRRPAATRSRAYLRHFWSHWSGPDYEPADADLDRLADVYGAPGAFTASIGWYRAGSGTVATSLGRARARARGPARGAATRPVARARPAVPAGLVATGSRSSSPTSAWDGSPASGTSCRSRRPTRSRARSPTRSPERQRGR